MENNKRRALLVAIAIPVAFIMAVLLIAYLPGLLIKPTEQFVYTVDTGIGSKYGSWDQSRQSYRVEKGKIVQVDYLSERCKAGKNGELLQTSPSLPRVDSSQPEVDLTRICTLAPDQLFLHDMKTNRSREITFEEAAALRVDPSQASPNGFRIEGRGFSTGLFYGYDSGDYNARYFVGKGLKVKLNLVQTGNDLYSGDNAALLGWIQ